MKTGFNITNVKKSAKRVLIEKIKKKHLLEICVVFLVQKKQNSWKFWKRTRFPDFFPYHICGGERNGNNRMSHVQTPDHKGARGRSDTKGSRGPLSRTKQSAS